MLSLLAVLALMLALSTTVLAHGGTRRGHHQPARQTPYALCTVEGCAAAQNHCHSGTWYRGNAATSGDYAFCAIADCTAETLHEHEGVWYHCPISGTTAIGPGSGYCRQ